LKPAVKSATPGTPASAHSRTTSMAGSAGRTSVARSGRRGRAAMLGKDRIPMISLADGFTT
jgi:hypothetical protein